MQKLEEESVGLLKKLWINFCEIHQRDIEQFITFLESTEFADFFDVYCPVHDHSFH